MIFDRPKLKNKSNKLAYVLTLKSFMSSSDQLTPTSSSSSLFSSLSHDNIDLSSNPIWFARLQEVLLMHRPFDFCVLLAVVELIFGFIYFLNLGIFATIALLGLISYMLFIHYCHPNPIFEKIFFPPLKKPIDQTQPNRIRSYEEFSNFIASIHHGFQHYFGHKHLTGIKRIIFGVGSFIFALLLKRVVPFWVNFLLVHCILFLPLAILRPWPTKDAPGEEPRQEESIPQTASQATTTEATQATSAQSTPQDSTAAGNANSNNNQNDNDNSNTNQNPNPNTEPTPIVYREVVMEETDEDPLRDAANISTPFSTPSSKSTANSNNNSNALPTPISTPSSGSHPTSPISPSSNHPPIPSPPSSHPQIPTPPSAHPPIPPPQQPSTPKPAANTTSNPSVATKAATVPKKKGLSKLKFNSKRKNNKDGTD